MNQVINPEALVSAVPLEREVKKMTKKEKLLLLAGLVRACNRRLALASGLESWEELTMKRIPVSYWGMSAFSLAQADPVLQQEGFKSSGTAERNPSDASFHDATKFFELTRDEMHEFSCDCGGAIGNAEMADRIERIANRS